MSGTFLNQSLDKCTSLIFGGDYEVVGPDPALGQRLVSDLSADFVLIHYHHRHEFQGGSNKGLWGTVARGKNIPYDWQELDHTITSAKEHFSLVALYPIGWAHMIPEHLGETILDVDPEVVSDWVCTVVERYWKQVDIFPIFYEMNAFDLFFRATHGQPYGSDEKRHIIECLVKSAEKILDKCGEIALSKLTAATFVELTQSSFYWMSEGKLLELPRGSALLHAPLSPPDLLEMANKFDREAGKDRCLPFIRQLLHQMIFWNADDSGAKNTVGDDLKRIYKAGFIYHPDTNPNGVVHKLFCGWDAQPQNTYEYLLSRLLPNQQIPTCAELLEQNFLAFQGFLEGTEIDEISKQAICGFVLDDIFKCSKQSGITSAIYPTEHALSTGCRHAGEPLTVSAIGEQYKVLIWQYKHPNTAWSKTHGSEHSTCTSACEAVYPAG